MAKNKKITFNMESDNRQRTNNKILNWFLKG